MSDDVPRSRRSISAITQPEVPVAKSQSNRMQAVRPFAVKIGDDAPRFPALEECIGRPLILFFAPAAVHGTLAISLRDAHRELEKKSARALFVVAGASPHVTGGVEVVADPDGSIHRKYGVLDDDGRPRLSAFLVNSDGQISGVFVPGEPERALRLALDALDLAR